MIVDNHLINLFGSTKEAFINLNYVPDLTFNPHLEEQLADITARPESVEKIISSTADPLSLSVHHVLYI